MHINAHASAHVNHCSGCACFKTLQDIQTKKCNRCKILRPLNYYVSEKGDTLLVCLQCRNTSNTFKVYDHTENHCLICICKTLYLDYVPHKKCSGCGVNKPLSMFIKNGKKELKTFSVCRKCDNNTRTKK